MQKRFIVQGRVQGVGFRQFTLAKARALSVSGFVRNLPDGSVECVARGSEEDLAELESILRKGPPVSRVESVASLPSDVPVPPGFRIA